MSRRHPQRLGITLEDLRPLLASEHRPEMPIGLTRRKRSDATQRGAFAEM
jgi:hypothetical protein